jgi:hypothetical protein
MMQENNNELENLYRKAAENFPLKTDGANWQAVLEQLEKDDHKKLFWWNRRSTALSLLLIGFIVGSIFIVTKFIDNKTALNKAFVSKQVTEKQLQEIKNQNKNLERNIADKVYKKVMDSLNKQNMIASDETIIRENKSSFTSKKLHEMQSAKSINEILNTKKFTARNASISSTDKEIKTAKTNAVVDLYKSTNKNNATNNELSVANIADNTKDEITTTTNSTTKVDSFKKNIAAAVVRIPKNKEKFQKCFYVGAMYAFQKCSVLSEGFKAGQTHLNIILYL